MVTVKSYIRYLKNKPHPKRTGMCGECQFEYFDGKESHAPTCAKR
jgi:hypothetical protein